MSIVHDQIRRLDLHVDKFQLSSAIARRNSTASTDAFTITEHSQSPRAAKLKSIIRALSTSSAASPQLSSKRLIRLLDQTKDDSYDPHAQNLQSEVEEELEWVVVAKAAVQTYGLVMEALLEQMAPISNELWYWDGILTSYSNTSLYTLQTAPLRVLERAKELIADVRHRQRSIDASSIQESLSNRWRNFYNLVHQSVSERSLMHARTTVLSPFALSRSEAQKKQNGLKRLRELSASGLGLLVNEGLSFPVSPTSEGSDSPYLSKEDWRSTVEKSVTLMESVLWNVCLIEHNAGVFEETVFSSVEDESEIFTQRTDSKSQYVLERLQTILLEGLPFQNKASDECFAQYGRPSRIVRYWLPGVVLLLSGSTLLKIIANRRAEIITWIQEFGATTRDFWLNWVIEPIKKVVGTIRHDEASEVAIMSKDSLRADRDSLERMVVEFAADHPENSTAYSHVQLQEIGAKVKEGDLTPVLKAYERDLRKPFMGTVRGDLIRALLIQVQKTKVDVEVAIGGIDSLLKSQELVFGLVGLTPGILVSFATFRWLGTVFGNRRGGRLARQQGETRRTLRNIDRILDGSTQTQDGMLSYKDHGMLMGEVHVLRQKALAVIPARIHREFLEDVYELSDVKVGVHRQGKALHRIRWAYGKWLQ